MAQRVRAVAEDSLRQHNQLIAAHDAFTGAVDTQVLVHLVHEPTIAKQGGRHTDIWTRARQKKGGTGAKRERWRVLCEVALVYILCLGERPRPERYDVVGHEQRVS